MENEFIKVFDFVDDTSKPGRNVSWVKIGDIYMTRVVIKPGVTTGNYYHKETRQMFYVGNSPVHAVFEHVQTKERQELFLDPAKKAIHIPPYVAIATKNVGKEDSVLVFFSNNPLRSDSFEYKVL